MSIETVPTVWAMPEYLGPSLWPKMSQKSRKLFTIQQAQAAPARQRVTSMTVKFVAKAATA